MGLLSPVWSKDREDKQVIQKSTAWRTLNEITVKVYDKSAGTRFIIQRAEMLLKEGERLKLLKKRYPVYIYAVITKED
jgi:hypothetical protein